MEQYPILENLSLFVKVVEAGSFSKVSKQHRIPKASLSRRITQLEQYYGTQLLLRNTRHIALTEIGREVLSKAYSMLSLADETMLSVSKTKQMPSGNLRITAGVEYGLSTIAPVVDKFLKKYPDVNIELDLTGRRVDLIYENFDLGVRIGPLEDSTLSMRKIGSFRYGLFASLNFVKKNKEININNLSSLPTLGFTRIGTNKVWNLFNKLEKREVQVSPRLTSNNYWVLMESAINGLGIVFMPAFLAQKNVKRKKLINILPEWSSDEIPVHFLYPAQKYLNSKVRTFIDFAIDQINP
ncbi:MAG: LysR family transcriptional regulator [Bacteriovoracaceae bacterium]